MFCRAIGSPEGIDCPIDHLQHRLKPYQSSSIGTIQTKDSNGRLNIGVGSGGERPRGHGTHGGDAHGGSSPDGAEGLTREHGDRGRERFGGLVGLKGRSGGLKVVVMGSRVRRWRFVGNFGLLLPYGRTRGEAPTFD